MVSASVSGFYSLANMSFLYFHHSESIEQLALNEVCVTVHLLLTAVRPTPAVRASCCTVRAS